MVKDRRTKPQLLDELGTLRSRVAHLEGLERRAGTEGLEQVHAQDLETLFAVARDLAGLGGMEEKATKVLVRIADVMDAEWVVLRLLDEEAQMLRLVSFVGAGLDELPPLPVLRRGQLISGQAFEQRRALVVNDYESHAGADPARLAQGMRSGVSLVLTAGGRMVGTLQVNSSTPDHFTAERVRFLTAIADGMGALLENARLLEAVRESEERYRTLFEQSGDAIYMSSDDRLVDVNQAALRMFGYTREDALKVHLDDLFADKADRRLFREQVARFGAVKDFETRLLRRDGTEFHSVVTSAQRKAPDGTLVGTAGIIRDITERKQAEEEARLRTQELEALFSVASLLVGPGTFGDKARNVLEEVARVVEGDRVILRLADDEQQGLRLVATAGEDSQNPEPPPLLAYGELLAGEAFEQGRPVIANDYASRETAEAARETHGIKSAIALPIESGGRTLGTVVVSSRMADHFTARRVRLLTAIANGMGVLLENAGLLERTRESEERYRSLFEHSKEAIFISRGHQMTEVNQAGLDLLGYAADDVPGLNYEDLWVEPSAMQRMGEELSAKGSVQDFEVKFRKKGGAVIDCAVTMTQYRSADGTLLGEEGIIHDITARKRAEELFRIVAESSPVAVFLVQDEKFSFVNHQFESITGYTAEEIIGQTALSLVIPDDRQTVQDKVVRILDGERLQAFEYRAHDKAGDVVWVLGTCALIDYEGKPAVLHSFSDITARKHAEEETRQLARENSVMAEIGRVIGSSLDVDAVYEHFAEHVHKLIPFDRIDITLPGAEPGTVMHAYQSGVKAPGRMRGDVYPFAGTATEEVLKTGEEILCHARDAAEIDARFPGLRPAFDSGLRSFMGIPLVTRNEVFGALFIASETPDAYSARDLSMAKRVGSQIAGAIANAQLYSDRARAEEAQARLAERLNLLNELMRIAVSNLNVTEVFDGVSEQVKKLIDHDRLSIDLLRTGESSSELYPFVAVGFGAVGRGLSMPLASPIGEVVRTGKPILRGDLLRGGTYPIEAEIARTTGIRSAMFVPLTSRGRVIGCLTFSSVQAGNYDERELDTAQTIADHLAVIVEHAQLYEETKRAEEQLRAINEVAISTSSVLQLDDLLPYVTGLLHDTFGWDVVNVLLTDDKNENVVLRATLGQRDKAVAPGFKVDIAKHGIISWVAKTGEPLLANDVSQEPRYHLNEARPNIKSELAVAIKREDDVLGVLDIESERLDAFDRADVSTAQSLANQLAVAIENARLFELARDLAVLEERNRMAREIHDTMAQGFTGIVLQLEAAEQAFEDTPTEIPDHLGRAKGLARTCLQEARRSVWNLLPRALEERPLSEALEKEVAQWAGDGPETASFTLSGASRELDADIQAALLRICQESLTNIRKHARASQVSVQVSYLPSSVRLEIKDDGVGFDAKANSQDGMQHGFGLLGMKQRARLIRGMLEVKSEQGHGTTISVEVPTG